MKDNEAIRIMRFASEEIKSLRKTNDRLAPQADAYATLRQVLNLLPQRSEGAGMDVVWMLDARIQELESADSKE